MRDKIPAVELLTDAHGVTHVYVEDRDEYVDEDELYALSYANGYVQARDRLFEMDALRHIGYGDSASVLGPMQLDSDVQVTRDLYSRDELKAQYDAASTVTRVALEGFSGGVNRRLIECLVDRDLPAEFLALGHAPEPWSPVDSVAVLAYMVGFFGVDGGTELENAKNFAELADSLGDERASYEAYGDLNWLSIPDEHSPTIDAAELTVESDESIPGYETVPDEQLELAHAAADAEPWGIDAEVLNGGIGASVRRATGALSGFRWGSNALAVAGEHTDTGGPMLFGGPQMGYFAPPVIHEIGLHGAGFDVAGVGVVGTPGVVIGRTPEFAWTVTSGYDDQVDTIAVEVHPEDRHRYRWNGEWRRMETETVVHRPSLLGALGNGDWPRGTVEQELAYIEERGDSMPVVAWNPDEHVAWCQRTTTRGDELEGVFAWAELGRQESFEEFETQLAEFPFTFNFIYADDEDIAFVHTGKVPDRNPSLDHRFPAPGSDHRWESMTTGTGMNMTVRNPDSGYFVQWNNAPVAGWRAGDAAGRWGSIHRVDLLDDLTQDAIADGPLSLDDVAGILRDVATRSPIAGASTPVFVEAAREAGMDAIADELERWAAAEYTWETENGRYLPGFAIWETVRRELQELAFRDELGDRTPELRFDPPTEIDLGADEDPHAGDHGRTIREVTVVDALAGRTGHDWLGEDREKTVQTALERARETLADRFGTGDPSAWRQEARTTGFMAISAAEGPEIELVNRGSWNQVVSLATGEGRGILPPGNSGHLRLGELPKAVVGDPPARLTDQLEPYESFEYKPFPIERSAVEANAERHESLSVWRQSGLSGQALGVLSRWFRER
ncbi:penicillin acylase family protein [Halococcus qingdaonensis]|uniref:penicillin acylase family protein n=1 Tax=Halococcus qingdaonensis TaxID=224402 RepID=UPI002115D085|nr:penicillin acylase family protein [Halococcus qingdaonensis]